MAELLISVIIPTCNRNDLLSLCLQKLEPHFQSLPSDKYEVIVSDDGKSFTAQEIIGDNFPWVKWVKGPSKGPAANRNNGASFAQGKWLVFTDDDCLPQQEWLSKYENAIERNNKIYAFEGSILPTDIEELESSDLAACPVNTTGGNFWSANIMVSNELFRSVGGFDEDYFLAAQEDQQFKLDVQKISDIVFIHDCIVYHPIKRLKLSKEISSIPLKAKNYALYILKNQVGPSNSFTIYKTEIMFHLRSFVKQLLQLKPKNAIINLMWLIYGINFIVYYSVNLSVEKRNG